MIPCHTGYSRSVVIIEVLRGSVLTDVTPAMAMGHVFQRYLKNISSWACTTKVFIVLHRCLQDTGGLAQNMAKELKSKEHLLHGYQKKASDDTYETQMYQEITTLYNSYLKFLYTYKLKSTILSVRLSEVSAKLKNAPTSEILANYESFDALITQIFSIFEHQTFCKRTRLFSNVIYLLFTDLLQIYKVFYVLVTEILERFTEMSVDQAKKGFIVYQNFVNLTNVMRGKADKIVLEFGFTVKMPQYYTPDASLVNTLRLCVEQKQRGGASDLDKISKQLRGGMDKD